MGTERDLIEQLGRREILGKVDQLGNRANALNLKFAKLVENGLGDLFRFFHARIHLDLEYFLDLDMNAFGRLIADESYRKVWKEENKKEKDFTSDDQIDFQQLENASPFEINIDLFCRCVIIAIFIIRVSIGWMTKSCITLNFQGNR